MATQSEAPVKPGEGRVQRRSLFDLFEALEEDLSRLWPAARMPSLFPLPRPRAIGPVDWAPRMDVFEKQGDLVIKAELPGVNREDIEIMLEDGQLVLRGERKGESEVTEKDYYRMERSYGSFYRRFPLPFEAAADQIKASFHDGVLEIHVATPVEEKPPTQKIRVT